MEVSLKTFGVQDILAGQSLYDLGSLEVLFILWNENVTHLEGGDKCLFLRSLKVMFYIEWWLTVVYGDLSGIF